MSTPFSWNLLTLGGKKKIQKEFKEGKVKESTHNDVTLSFDTMMNFPYKRFADACSAEAGSAP